MGTNNWQNIPFCVDVLVKIAPQRVLDVGVGFGRWGMIVREFCDVWYGRVSHSQWSVHIEGIEVFKKNISHYHEAFYNKIHFGDAKKIIPSLGETWDVVIFGNVLEHFERQTGELLLAWCLDHATYMLVNIPLGSEWSQCEMYENPYEKHLSVWNEEDFNPFGLCRKALFLDYTGRPFGSFVLSRSDPKMLHQSLFSKTSDLAFLGSKDIQGSENIYAQALLLRNQQLIAELNFIKNSRSYRLIEHLKTMPFSRILVKLDKWLMPGDLPATTGGSGGAVSQTTTPADSTGLVVARTTGQARPQSQDSRCARDQFDQAWVEQQLSFSKPLSINNPDWRGILASATELFGNIYKIPDNLDVDRAFYYAELFRDAAPPSITIQGFPLSYFHLVKAIRKIAPQIPILAIWHGSLLQSKEDYNWESFSMVRSLYDEGYIAKVGFVKMGMDEVMKYAGVKSHFLMNLVRRIPCGPSQPKTGNQHIAIWAEPDWGWRKLPYAMIASLSLVPEVKGYVYNVSPRAQEFGKWFNADLEFHIDPIPQDQITGKMINMHLNMYISLSECAPMVPLESLSVGVPCLFGPNSHYFLDHDYLHRRLVVPYPDHAEVIARYICRALDERTEIVNAYRNYAPGYNRRALQALADFVEYPMDEAL